MKWTAENENRLKELWGKGYTASQIAKAIGDTTRNACIGKVFRMGLSKRITKKIIGTKVQSKKNNSTKPTIIMTRSRFKLLLDKDFEPENPTTLEELSDNTCRWPIGHPDEENFYFCGRNPIKKYPYCKLHFFQSFQIRDSKEENKITEENIPKFIENKIKSA